MDPYGYFSEHVAGETFASTPDGRRKTPTYSILYVASCTMYLPVKSDLSSLDIRRVNTCANMLKLSMQMHPDFLGQCPSKPTHLVSLLRPSERLGFVDLRLERAGDAGPAVGVSSLFTLSHHLSKGGRASAGVGSEVLSTRGGVLRYKTQVLKLGDDWSRDSRVDTPDNEDRVHRRKGFLQ